MKLRSGVLPLIATSFLLACLYKMHLESVKTALAGIGTFPGGQSTGGYEEFDFEQPVLDRRQRARHTENDDAWMSRNAKQWTVVSGPCKGASNVKDLRECVTAREPAWAKNYNLVDGTENSTVNAALWKPGTYGVDTNSYKPSLEDVIGANKLPDLKPIYGKMKTLQDQLDVIKNTRNFDTEDLTPDTSRDWLDQTANLCCANMFDTICNQPCRVF